MAEARPLLLLAIPVALGAKAGANAPNESAWILVALAALLLLLALAAGRVGRPPPAPWIRHSGRVRRRGAGAARGDPRLRLRQEPPPRLEGRTGRRGLASRRGGPRSPAGAGSDPRVRPSRSGAGPRACD